MNLALRFVFVLVASVTLEGVTTAQNPTIMTDQTDYSPGQIVTITGAGWQPGETVTLTLVESPLIDTHPELYATADGNGDISNTQFSPDLHDVQITFTLTASGNMSGLQAQATFTDNITGGNVVVYQGTIGTCPGSSGNVPVGDSATACASNLTFSGNNIGAFQWVQPGGTVLACDQFSATGSNGSATSQDTQANLTIVGTWTVNIFKNGNCTGGINSIAATTTFNVVRSRRKGQITIGHVVPESKCTDLNALVTPQMLVTTL